VPAAARLLQWLREISPHVAFPDEFERSHRRNYVPYGCDAPVAGMIACARLAESTSALGDTPASRVDQRVQELTETL
jgi:hypothetical protein